MGFINPETVIAVGFNHPLLRPLSARSSTGKSIGFVAEICPFESGRALQLLDDGSSPYELSTHMRSNKKKEGGNR